jgi:hypothetical protein
MSDGPQWTGRCNCGAVRYTLASSPLTVAACHCTQCRRQSGAAYSVNLIVRASAMEVVGDLASWEDSDTESGAPLSREHCGKCGSPIRSVPSASPKLIAVKSGTLDDPSAFAPAMHIWVQSKLPWVTIPDGIPTFQRGPAG